MGRPRESSIFSRTRIRSLTCIFSHSAMLKPQIREASALGFSPLPPQVGQGERRMNQAASSRTPRCSPEMSRFRYSRLKRETTPS